MSRKAKEYLISALAVIGGIIGLIIMALYEQDNYPKLVRFGLQKWAVQCESEKLVYRLISYNPLGSNSTKSITRRSLSFLDEKEKRRYSIHRFDKNSLDQDSVWRFIYHEGLIKSFSKEDESKVLKGNEQVFEIAEDFHSLTITTKDEQKLKLSCQPATFK